MTPERTLKLEELNSDQRGAIDNIAAGHCQLITGGAGTGKSALLKYLKTCYNDMPLTASTGIAALNIGGCTLHSWLGLRPHVTEAEKAALDIIDTKGRVYWGIRKAKRLAIDEISMVDAKLFDLASRICQIVRNRHDEPFGGIQVIAFGDYLQLPPVPEEGEPVRFAFEARAWGNAGFRVKVLEKVMRQEQELFASILRRVRVGDDSEEVRSVLRPRIGAVDASPEIMAMELVETNAKADSINTERMEALPGDYVEWLASDWAQGEHNQAKLDRDCIAPKTLRLKVGAQVMLLWNKDMERGLVNGSLGKVIEIRKPAFGPRQPVVLFDNGVTECIDRETWQIKRNDDVLAERCQIPLRVGYAVTVHKSQGLTLSKARVHLKRAFAEGQAYVALSRARTLEGLFIADISGRSIKANQKALEFYRQYSS